jgi:hypothetical protein
MSRPSRRGAVQSQIENGAFMTKRFVSLPKHALPRTPAVALLLFFVSIGSRAVWAQVDCKAPFDSEMKLLATPHHSFQSQTGQAPGGKNGSSETIFVNDVFYVQVHGVWRKSPLTGDEMRKQEEENQKNARNISCKYLREETVDDQTARVYTAHSETDYDKTDATLWISKATGMPLKQEEDKDVGEGEAGKVHVSIRYEYKNVSAPPIR